MKEKTGSFFITAIVLLNVSACSYVKAMFPDKEKDYQYTTEIPAMILPDDLKQNHTPRLDTTASPPPVDTDTDAVAPPSADNPHAEDSASSATTANKSAEPTPAATASPETEPVIADTDIKVERIKFTEGENRLRINVPFTRAWRIVSKALSRKYIEVIGRNQDERLFTILYDPDEQKLKNNSFWDDVVFLFYGIQSNENKYLLKLEEKNQQTDITVIDNDRQLLSDAGSVKLLTLLEETIKENLAKK